MNIDFPLHFDDRRRTAATDLDEHVRDLIEQVLFTNPGERVNRPTFGSGLAAAGVRAEQRCVGCGDAGRGAGRAHAMARRGDHRRGGRDREHRLDVEDQRPVRRARKRHAAAGDLRAGGVMSATQYRCSNLRRRTLVGEHATLNGIDFLEVFDLDAIPVPSPRQRTLLVRFLKPVPALTVANIVIEGGVRVTPVKVLWAFVGGAVTAPPATVAEQTFFNITLPQSDHCLVVRTDSEGDFSPYRFRLVDAPGAAPGRSGSRSAARCARLHVQGRVPVGVRLPAARRVPAREACRARDQLSREGLRELPPPGARPPDAS